MRGFRPTKLTPMKTKLITNASKLLLLTLVAGLFAGCAATRPIGDVALGAGGAYLGHELSNGDPLATAAGAAGGVVVSETLHYAAKKQAEKAYATGYDKGKSDAVQQQYWLYVSMQRQRNQVSNVPPLSRATARTADAIASCDKPWASLFTPPPAPQTASDIHESEAGRPPNR